MREELEGGAEEERMFLMFVVGRGCQRKRKERVL